MNAGLLDSASFEPSGFLNNKDDCILKITRLVILTVVFFLISPGMFIRAQDIHESPQYQKFTEEDASGFNNTAKTVLAPAYPYLAEDIADRFEIRDKRGIGIDIGGGPGSLVLELCKQTSAFFWINVDINPFYNRFLFEDARENQVTHRIGNVFADAHHLPFRDNYADVIVSRGSLQFWKDRDRAFSEICRVLKPGGRAMIGRGFTGNMPLEVAKQVRMKQGGGPKYSPGDTAIELTGIMKDLGISDYKILRPRTDQDQVNYGVWVVFSKPGE
jgi:SAM-dependent methyltransferase